LRSTVLAPNKEPSLRTFLRTRGIRLAAALAVASGTAGLASLTALSGASAQADPVSTTAEAGVGADVTQDLYSALSGASAPSSSTTTFFTPLHATPTNDNTTIQSFDAFPQGGSTINPGCVTTKIGGPSFDRPNSTTAGITALLAAISGSGFENSSASCTNALVNVTGQIEFARAARGPASSGSTLTFIPYGRDAVAYVYYDHADGTLNALTTAQLNSIYSSPTASFKIGSDTIKGCLTITGSTPRKNLEAAIGVSDSTANTEATAAGCAQIQQNSGNAFWTNYASTLTSGTDAVIPISAGDWIAQFNGLAVDESATARTNGLDLGSISGGSPAPGKPYIVKNPGPSQTLAPNTTYYQSTLYGYDVYTVVPSAKINTSDFGFDASLIDLFVNTATLPANNAALCSTANQATVNEFGFDSLTAAEGSCGSTTTTGNS
jgi:hypothetical protein